MFGCPPVHQPASAVQIPPMFVHGTIAGGTPAAHAPTPATQFVSPVNTNVVAGHTPPRIAARVSDDIGLIDAEDEYDSAYAATSAARTTKPLMYARVMKVLP